MTELNLTIQARIEEAQQKLKKLEDQIGRIESPKIEFKVPSIGETIEGFKKLGETLKVVYSIAKVLPTKFGQTVQDLEEMGRGALDTFGKISTTLKTLSGVGAGDILRKSLDSVNGAALKVSSTIATIGFEIFGVTQAVDVLNRAFGGFFNDTVGRQIRLNETILRTKTALVATSDVARNGQRIADPAQALAALNKPIDSVLASIRKRSLDIAGTTSDAIISVFQTVATQIGSFGGSLKDAEDLAITFSSALGTLGMSDPGMAMQEIRSILQGDITNDSILARSIGITNKDVQKAKQSAGGLIDFLKKKLEPFVVGQAEAAKNFAGITSNIKEIQEEVARAFGAPALQPLLDFLTEVYQRLSLVFDQMTGIADTAGRITSGAISGVVGGLMGGAQARGFSERDQLQIFDKAQEEAIKFFKYIQGEIDNLRPELNKISTEVVAAAGALGGGLANLAAGLASFKFAEFKLMLSNFIAMGEILNRTVVPALSTLLKFYGEILKNNVVQYLNEVLVTFRALDEAGIMPIVRLLYVLKVAWAASLRTAYTWTKNLVTGVKNLSATILSALGSAVAAVGSTISNIGLSFTTAFTGMGQFLLQTVARLAAVIGMHLVTLGKFITATYPQFAALGNAIAGVGKYFKNLDIEILKAQIAVDKFGEKARDAMLKLRLGATQAGESVRTLGTTIGTWLGAQIGKAATAIWGMIKGLAMFHVWMFAVQAVVAAAANAAGQFSRAQAELNASTTAALAAERLVTIYKDVGENSSIAARAMRDFNKAIVEGQITKLKEQLPQLASNYTKAAAALVKARAMAAQSPSPYPQSGRIASETGRIDNTKSAEVAAKYARDQLIKAKRELENLNDKFDQSQVQTQNTEDISVLQRERQDIEEVVKEMRLNVEKEVRDVRFRTEREVAGIQQQVREAQRAAERSELARTLQQQTQGLTSIQASTADALKQFQLGLFDAQTEAQRKQFEITEKRIQLDKTITDYKVGMEKQIADIRKRMGDYDKKVIDYKAKKAEEERQKDLKAALYLTAKKTEGFVLPESESEVNQFRDAAAGAGFSARQAMALLKSPGVMEAIGALPGMKPADVVGLLSSQPQFGQFLRGTAGNDSAFLQGLDARLATLNNQGPGAGKYLFNLAGDDVSRRRDFQISTPKVPELKGFGGFSVDKYAAETKRLESSVIDATAALQDSISQLNTRENAQVLMDRLTVPGMYTGLPSIADLSNKVDEASASLENFSEALEKGDTSVSRDVTALQSWFNTSRQSLQGFLAGALKPDNQLNDAQKAQKRAFEQTALKTLADNPEKLEDLKLPAELLNDIIKNDPAAKENIQIALKNMARTMVSDMTTVLPQQVALLTKAASKEYQNEVVQRIATMRKQIVTSQLDLLSVFADFDTGDDPVKKRQAAAEYTVMQEVLRLRELQLEGDSEAIAQQEKLIAEIRSNATTLGEFEASLKQAAEALSYAREAASALVDGYKGLVKSALTGGDIKEAMESMLKGYLDKILDPLLDKAFKPMQDALEKQMREIFGIKDPADIVKEQYERLAGIAETSKKHLESIDNTVKQLASPGKAELPKAPIPAVGPSAAALAATVSAGANSVSSTTTMIRGGFANMLPGTKGGPNINEGVGWSAWRGRNHNGQDLGLDPGDPIHARRGGKVIDAYSSGFGKVGGAVVVKYDNGEQGTYGHVNPSVKVGDTLHAGQRIATVTDDGRNTHLHYELRDAVGKLLNPLQAIRESLKVPAGAISGGTVTKPVPVVVTNAPSTFPMTAPEPVNTIVPLSVIPHSEELTQVSTSLGTTVKSVAAHVSGLTTSLTESSKEIPAAAEEMKDGFKEVLGGIAGLAAGAMSIYGGISKMGEGGTYNTLMGLAGVFAGLGGIASGFGSGGGLASLFRADGGPVTARRPYIVGERGPELFVPGKSGTIIPNERLSSSPFAASESYLEERAPSRMALRNDPIKIDTRVINGVEYVTSDQLRQATSQAERRGAERGQALALGSMRNSVRTRKQVGMA